MDMLNARPDPLFFVLDAKAREIVRRLATERPDLAERYLAAFRLEDVRQSNAERAGAISELYAWLGGDASAFPSTRDLHAYVNINRSLLEELMAAREGSAQP